MEYMNDIKEMLCEELEKIANEGELTAGSLDTIQKLTHSLKSIGKIMEMEEEGAYSMDGGYGGSYRGSRQGGGNRGGQSNRRGSRRGGSYRGSREYRQGGSYRGSRAEEKEMIVERIEDMMDEVQDPQAKKALEKAINAMEM